MDGCLFVVLVCCVVKKREVKNASGGDSIGHLFDDVTLSLFIIKGIKVLLVAYVSVQSRSESDKGVIKGDTLGK